MHIAIAGFQHETNSFIDCRTDYDAFLMADAWPGLLTGGDILHQTKDCNLPTAGFVEKAVERGWDIIPLLWCSAGPSGKVTAQAYQKISDEIILRLEKCGAVDAVYLDLHGAMVIEDIPDADGDLIQRVRRLVGNEVLIVVSLDFHANISTQMAEGADALIVYRTYPHVDMAETGRRAAQCLHRISQQGREDCYVQLLNFLIPMGTQSTLDHPMAQVMDHIWKREGVGDNIEFAAGFPLADVYECGPSIVAYGENAKNKCAELVHYISTFEAGFNEKLYSPEEAVNVLKSDYLNKDVAPVILVDTQDNPGCGGTGDTVGLLKVLLESNIENIVAGVLCDPETAAQAHEENVGATISVKIGARNGFGETPLKAEATILALGTGHFTGTGPFYKGCHFELGPMALLAIGGVKIVISSVRQQAADQAMFHHLGVNPAAASVLVLKSSVHYRADFGDIAKAVLVVESPGAHIANLSHLTYDAIRPSMHIAGGGQIKMKNQGVSGRILSRKGDEK